MNLQVAMHREGISDYIKEITLFCKPLFIFFPPVVLFTHGYRTSLATMLSTITGSQDPIASGVKCGLNRHEISSGLYSSFFFLHNRRIKLPITMFRLFKQPFHVKLQSMFTIFFSFCCSFTSCNSSYREHFKKKTRLSFHLLCFVMSDDSNLAQTCFH